MGLPAVAPRLPVIERYFSDAEIAFFEPGSAPSLAQAIEETCAEPDLARARAERASERLKEIAWPVQRRAYLRLVDELVDAKANGGAKRVGVGRKSKGVRAVRSRKARKPRSSRPSRSGTRTNTQDSLGPQGMDRGRLRRCLRRRALDRLPDWARHVQGPLAQLRCRRGAVPRRLTPLFARRPHTGHREPREPARSSTRSTCARTRSNSKIAERSPGWIPTRSSTEGPYMTAGGTQNIPRPPVVRSNEVLGRAADLYRLVFDAQWGCRSSRSTLRPPQPPRRSRLRTRA